MHRQLSITPLESHSFSPFGEIIEIKGDPTAVINQGMCERYSDLASLEFVQDGRAGISLFLGQPYSSPLQLEYVERHPLGSQAFLPLSAKPYLVIVAADNNGTPSDPMVFVSGSGQGVNYFRGTWHGVLTPLLEPSLFAVIDRIGEGDNLEEFWFDEPYTIEFE